MEIVLKPIAYVRNTRTTPEDDNWGAISSQIILVDTLPDYALEGIDTFSHLEIIYHFHQVPVEKATVKLRHPRNNPDYPKIGSLAQRNKSRPNRLGLTTVKLLKRVGNTLTVENLDAIDGTPILDIKPVFTAFLPDEPIQEPDWVKDLMKQYW